jgi:hypothetical protein
MSDYKNRFDLSSLAQAVHEQAPYWDAADIKWDFKYGPSRDKSAAWVTCESELVAAQLTVLTSGEAELEVGSVFEQGGTTLTHHELTTAEDLAACLKALGESTRP